eukprot:6210531-Pleurochrysis_carterae.AAC.1
MGWPLPSAAERPLPSTAFVTFLPAGASLTTPYSSKLHRSDSSLLTSACAVHSHALVPVP